MPSWGGVLASHVIGVALMLWLMLQPGGENPRAFIYGFFFSYLYRLVTLQGLLVLDGAGAQSLARMLSRPPHPERPSMPVHVETKTEKRPGGFGIYMVVMAAFAGFTFIVVNVKDDQIGTPTALIQSELASGLTAALLWWLIDLVDRRITIQFGEPAWKNFGYNSMETSLLAVTVLTGGVASAIMETPWPYFAALVIFKTWFDVWEEKNYPRARHAHIGSPPARGRQDQRST